jgi:hypothetical protein
MGYKDKMNEGIDVKAGITFAQLDDIVRNIVQTMGNKAVVYMGSDENAGIIRFGLYKTGAQKVATFSVIGSIAGAITKATDMDAHIAVKQTDGGKLLISTHIDSAGTTQVKVMGFVPASPKAVHGITTYRDFCDHLSSEISRICPDAAISKRQ